MRNEQEMMNVIKSMAAGDERVRAVYMNGSRTNPAAPKDIFQDYDIVYVVTETASFIRDRQWISRFGELIMLQEPDRLDEAMGKKVDLTRHYAYLMLFTDGNRIDLTLQSFDAMKESYGSDSLTVPILDKDGILPVISEPSDRNYRVTKPTAAAFEACANDFWWCLQNVAKGIWRDELPYAKRMFNDIVRNSLDRMVDWSIGMRHDFRISTGKMGKYYKTYLPDDKWNLYMQTYSDASYENLWEAVFAAIRLFYLLGSDVARHFGYRYPEKDDERMTAYLKHIRTLPSGAKEIF